MAELTDAELLAALGVAPPPKPVAARTPEEERVLAGFEDIQRFVETHGRPPRHGEDRDIFERLYAVRLDRLRESQRWRDLLGPLDAGGLLAPDPAVVTPAAAAEMDDAALMAALGVAAPAETDVTALRHVKPREEVRAAEEIADRTPCRDFSTFEPLFARVRADMAEGVRRTRRFERMAEIQRHEFFIVGGQIAYVAEVGEAYITDYDRRDSRLRVIYDNGTESDLTLRSLQRALHRDEAGRRITNPSAGPLFGEEADADDLESGTIYVLRSRSDHPTVAAHRALIHKIGVTGGRVEARLANAAQDPTYLLAAVEVVATYQLFNVDRVRLEALFHRLFANARLELTIEDRFGQPVRPREWFLVPLPVIDEAVARIRDGSIAGLVYDPESATLRAA
ncbi:GIY-YIG nuclease family protein [Methylobacterium sp. sgz302541]|uniref:GIY-YIG nuclease family protein n=1 Tax=unclassified Methylobacterium TaxID=2615210 RepID=UPI003D330B99